MSLITVDELREFYETDLSDDALQKVIDGQEAYLVRKMGEHESAVQVFSPTDSKFLYLNRPAQSITSITERVYNVPDDGNYTDTILEADDYSVIATGKRIDRVADGTNPRVWWGNRVTVVYVPIAQAGERINVLVDLCKLTCEYNALKSESTGDYSAAQKDYDKERKALVAQLETGLGIA